MRTRVLVTGARGKSGRQVVAQLSRRSDVEVRAAGRDPDSIDLPTAVRFDWDDGGTWGAALEGIDAVYLVKPGGEDDQDLIAAFLAAARAALRVVVVSEIAADRQDPAANERRIEDAARAASVPCTILRLNWFMQNLVDPHFSLDAVRAGRLVIPTAGMPMAWVDSRDIAAVAVEALLDGAHEGRTYAVTGPEAIAIEDLGHRLSAAAGHDVEGVDGPAEDALGAMAERGLPRWRIDYYGRVYANIASGAMAEVSGDVERVTGRPPRTLDAFAAEHAAAWRR